jgi:hypothetical protein
VTRRGAVLVAHRAHRRLDVSLFVALCIALACRKFKLRYALGFALVQQESNYQHIFGHDAGGLFPGLSVTRTRYRQLRDHLRSSGGAGANGVGLTQITYYTYVLDHPGLWRKRANLYFGLSILADYVHRLGERTGCGAYNGGEGNPQYGYADEVLAKASAIRPKLSNRKH